MQIYADMCEPASENLVGRITDAEQRYADLRAKLIRAGFSLRSFADKFGYRRSTVYDAAHGRRAGVTTTKIRTHLERLCHEVTPCKSS